MARKRRNFDAEFKTRVVLELLTGKKSLAEASREYDIKDTILSRWKQEFLSKATQVFEQPQDVQAKDVRIAELERMVGKLTMKVELQHLPGWAAPGKKVLNLDNSRLRNDE